MSINTLIQMVLFIDYRTISCYYITETIFHLLMHLWLNLEPFIYIRRFQLIYRIKLFAILTTSLGQYSHKFSVGLKSELLPDHAKMSAWFCPNHLLVDTDE